MLSDWGPGTGLRPTSPCPRCGAPAHIFHFQPPLRDYPLFREGSYVAACGHGQPFVPVPTRDGGSWWVPVLFDAP
jgi:hypothetical protein